MLASKVVNVPHSGKRWKETWTKAVEELYWKRSRTFQSLCIRESAKEFVPPGGYSTYWHPGDREQGHMAFAITFDKETGMFDFVQNVACKMGATEQEVRAIEEELGVERYTPPTPPIVRVQDLDDTSDLDGIE